VADEAWLFSSSWRVAWGLLLDLNKGGLALLVFLRQVADLLDGSHLDQEADKFQSSSWRSPMFGA
jgi:hypothetical protein